MSLYDGLGLDSGKDKQILPEKKELVGWSSGIKLLQSQLQLKKAALTQVKRDQIRKGSSTLPPVLDLKSRRDDADDSSPPPQFSQNREPFVPLHFQENNKSANSSKSLYGSDAEWNVQDEYDPMWPNDYEKIIKERRDKKEKDREEDRLRAYEERERRRRERYNRDSDQGENRRGRRDNDDDPRPRRGGRKYSGRDSPDDTKGWKYSDRGDSPDESSSSGMSGAAIPPPLSLLEDGDRREGFSMQAPGFSGAGFAPSLGSGSVAAKIMAKYGFREGQGLGKSEQGMSQALQVEKTSKRGGKIIHEKDVSKDPTPLTPPPPPSLAAAVALVPQQPQQQQQPQPQLQPQSGPIPIESITEAMKNPSKVVLLRNMVGPGEVDEELEPETKEECAKYGEVIKCLIFEIPGTIEEEAVRIFIEFKRLESAIKAVVDLNGRFFGGRVVRAGFYNVDRFRRFDLAD